MATLDSYSETNKDSDSALTQNWSGVGSAKAQSFTTPNDGESYMLTSAKLYLKTSAATYNLVVEIYVHSGTYGTSSIPTGTALATSVAVTSDIAADFSLFTFTFSGGNQICLSPNTHYVLVIKRISASNHIYIGRDGSAPSHSGNYDSWDGSAWEPVSTQDCCFYVYGIKLNPLFAKLVRMMERV